MQDRRDFISMCTERLVDVDKADKDTLKESSGRIWSTKGTS